MQVHNLRIQANYSQAPQISSELENNFNSEDKLKPTSIEERQLKNPFLRKVCEKLLSKAVEQKPWISSYGFEIFNYPHYFYKAWKMKMPLKEFLKELFINNFTNTKSKVVIQSPTQIKFIEQREKKEAEIKELNERARLRILAEKSQIDSNLKTNSPAT